MKIIDRGLKVLVVVGVLVVSGFFAYRFGTGGLLQGLDSANAVAAPGQPKAPYDLTQLSAVNETLKTIRKKYVEPGRVKPQQMFLSALDRIQREVAQVIVLHEGKSKHVQVRVGTESKKFRVDNVRGPWDVSARLRDVFAFLQKNLKDTDVDLREIEYAACNGMLSTLDPHSVFMSPESYQEMNLSTSGHFGGLGIVISIRDQMLTIMRPMPGTPAGRAGLKRLDRITKINDESTLNMPLDDAVARLRGEPSTKVTIHIHRDGKQGWSGSRPFVLQREQIRIRSVESRQLQPGIGYVRLKHFQSTTSKELEAALDKLRDQEPLRGLVLDLRGNPGGLLDQAAKVADRFLDHGALVVTVGGSEGREEKKARRHGTEPPYPIVVLTNPSSASASEIVAGALKNHDRAVIVGQRTFGKGTVQLIFPKVTPDGAALKLTIAQYLTPGDVSIQGVGVTPDVELDPMTADTLEMDLYRTDHPLRERDLSKSLNTEAKRPNARPSFKLRYNLPEKERSDMRDRGADLDDEFREDFPIKFAKELVGKMPVGRRQDQLRAVKPLIERVEGEQLEGVVADLKKLGIDWAAPPKEVDGPAPNEFEVSVKTDQSGNNVTAGKKMNLEVTVKNNGTRPVYRLRATTKSDSGYYDGKELVFGKIKPGESRSAKVPLGWCDIEGRRPGSTKPLPLNAKRVCSIPKDATSRRDAVKVSFEAAGSEAPADVELRPTVKALPQPVFAYTYQIVDNRKGNGDGQASRGEGFTVYLTVKNVGTGASFETQANLRNLTGAGLVLKAGRFDISNMAPGDVRQVAFTMDLRKKVPEKMLKVELSVADRELRVFSSEKISMPIAGQGLGIQDASGQVAATSDLEVFNQPVAAARIVGSLTSGAILDRVGTFGKYTKVLLGEGSEARFGFVESAKVKDAQGKANGKLKPLLVRSPPVLEVKSASLSTEADTVKVEGVATDGDRVLDVYIFVGSNKAFYRSNKKGADPKKMAFSHLAKLRPGVNVITVVARENEDTATRRTIVVRKDGPGGETLPTPKRTLFGADWEFTQ